MKIAVVVNLSEAEVDHWMRQSILMGFLREEPRRTWTDRERKQAVRFAMRRFLSEAAGKKYDGANR